MGAEKGNKNGIRRLQINPKLRHTHQSFGSETTSRRSPPRRDDELQDVNVLGMTGVPGTLFAHVTHPPVHHEIDLLETVQELPKCKTATTVVTRTAGIS